MRADTAGTKRIPIAMTQSSCEAIKGSQTVVPASGAVRSISNDPARLRPDRPGMLWRFPGIAKKPPLAVGLRVKNAKPCS